MKKHIVTCTYIFMIGLLIAGCSGNVVSHNEAETFTEVIGESNILGKDASIDSETIVGPTDAEPETSIAPEVTEISCSSFSPEETSPSESLPKDTDAEAKETYIYDHLTRLYKEHKNHLLISCFECLVWKEQRTIVVVISTGAAIVDRSVIFSKDGQLLQQTGITAISVDDVSSLLNMTEEELTLKYGKYHFDYGSGRYLPAYVTDNGSVLVLSIEDDAVTSVTEHRLTDGNIYPYGYTPWTSPGSDSEETSSAEEFLID